MSWKIILQAMCWPYWLPHAKAKSSKWEVKIATIHRSMSAQRQTSNTAYMRSLPPTAGRSKYYTNDTLNGTRVLVISKAGDTGRGNPPDGHFEATKIYYDSGKLEIEGQYRGKCDVRRMEALLPNGKLMEVVTFAENAENEYLCGILQKRL